MQSFHNKENSPDFSNPMQENAYIQNTQNAKDLHRKEYDTNLAEQNLLTQRISLMKSFANELPSSDPQYSMLLTQIQMDQLELDELKVRITLLSEKLDTEIN